MFDILHRGHATYLCANARLGAALIVAVNTDASALCLGKGPERPLNTMEKTAPRCWRRWGALDWVTSFDEDTPEALIA